MRAVSVPCVLLTGTVSLRNEATGESQWERPTVSTTDNNKPAEAQLAGEFHCGGISGNFRHVALGQLEFSWDPTPSWINHKIDDRTYTQKNAPIGECT